MRRKTLQVKYAFTVIELLIVLIVVAAIASMILPDFLNHGRYSRESALQSDLSRLRNAVQNFSADTGLYPDQLNDLTATQAPATGRDSQGRRAVVDPVNWHGPYLTPPLPTDPISRQAFLYSMQPGQVGKVTSSAGTPYDTW